LTNWRRRGVQEFVVEGHRYADGRGEALVHDGLSCRQGTAVELSYVAHADDPGRDQEHRAGRPVAHSFG
jgi:hypothetical protein